MGLFKKAAKEVFGGSLSEAGFALLRARTEEFSADILYRKNDQYLRISASVHPRDSPPFFNIVLGEGSTEWPESDWNSIPLWRIKKRLRPESNAGEYPLKDPALYQKSLAAANEELGRYAGDWLRGDMDLFREVRAIQNRSREPYKIHTADANGDYTTRDDEESLRMKEKFS